MVLPRDAEKSWDFPFRPPITRKTGCARRPWPGDQQRRGVLPLFLIHGKSCYRIEHVFEKEMLYCSS